MKKILLSLALGAAGLGHAQVPREPTPQQQLQTTCNYEAGVRELQGQDRVKFVLECIAEGRRRQQQVMAECVAESRARHPLERRAFMAECIRR